MAKIDRSNIADHLASYQFSVIGESDYTAYRTPDWRTKWTITNAQFADFQQYALRIIKKVFKCNSSKANKIFNEFVSSFGLTINDNPTFRDEPEKL